MNIDLLFYSFLEEQLRIILIIELKRSLLKGNKGSRYMVKISQRVNIIKPPVIDEIIWFNLRQSISTFLQLQQYATRRKVVLHIPS